jgi:hypothetical protein
VRSALGCPTTGAGSGEIAGRGADQVFRNGTMYWWANTDIIYVLLDDRAGSYQTFDQAQTAGQPDPPPDADPRMKGGFSRIYYGVSEIRATLGEPLAPERSIDGAFQRFERGFMFYSPPGEQRGGMIYVFTNQGNVTRYDDRNPAQ